MGFYHRRHPERSDYYRLLESGFEAFARNWPEDFESRYGFLRKEVQGAVFAFLECGIPENGVARVRCSGCGHDFFVAFSCRTRVVCPNCTTRRSLLFGEKVLELVHPPASAGSRCGSSPSLPIHMRSLRYLNLSGNRPRVPRP